MCVPKVIGKLFFDLYKFESKIIESKIYIGYHEIDFLI